MNQAATENAELARGIDARLAALQDPRTEAIRSVRKDYSQRLKKSEARLVVDLALELIEVYGRRFVAYELIQAHPGARRSLTFEDLERLGRGMASWEAVDTFGAAVAGPAWRMGQVEDDQVMSWARSPDRWWRRAALVCTVALNLPARGGKGDVERTLAVCRELVADRDDMVVKALSWALRELIKWDRTAVEGFLAEHENTLAARVKREVRTKLATGLKNPKGREKGFA